jgi:hypothetical protein
VTASSRGLLSRLSLFPGSSPGGREEPEEVCRHRAQPSKGAGKEEEGSLEPQRLENWPWAQTPRTQGP